MKHILFLYRAQETSIHVFHDIWELGTFPTRDKNLSEPSQTPVLTKLQDLPAFDHRISWHEKRLTGLLGGD